MSTNLNDKERCELERRMQAHVDQLRDEPGDDVKVEPLEKGFMSDALPRVDPMVGRVEKPNQEFIDQFSRQLAENHRKSIDAALIEPPLTFEEYQAGAKKTAIYNQDARVLYPALGLAGEVGEVAEKVLAMAAHAGKAANQVKKIIRDDDCECDTDRKHEIGKEIGGVLWYCAAVCSDLGLDMGEIAKGNLGVLADRQKRGVIQGSGDNR